MWRINLHPRLAPHLQKYFLAFILCVSSTSMYTLRHMNKIALSLILDLHAYGPEIVNSTVCDEDEIEMFVTTMATTIDSTPEAERIIPYNKDYLMNAESLEETIFYAAYMITHIPGGIISDRIGGKKPAITAITASALVNLLFPLAIHYQPYLILILQIINGLFTGPYFPSLAAIIARWCVAEERGSVSGLCFSGIFFSYAINLWLGHYLIVSYGWEFGYVLVGVFGLIAAAFLFIWVFSDPESHPFLTDEEKLKITEKRVFVLPRHEMAPIPWVKIMISIHVWAIFIGNWGHKWCQRTLKVDLPVYMERLTRNTISRYGFMGALPHILMGITCISVGFFGDFMIRRKSISVENCRKIIAGFGFFIPAIFCLMASYQGCGFKRMYVLFMIANMAWGLLYPSLKLCIIDLSPNYAGTVMAIVNGFAQTAWMAAASFTDFITEKNTLEEWRFVFWTSYIIAGFTYLFAINLGKFEVQKWNNKRMKSYKR